MAAIDVTCYIIVQFPVPQDAAAQWGKRFMKLYYNFHNFAISRDILEA
jgi:hypothetical protein